MRDATDAELEVLSRLHQTISARARKNALRSRFVAAEAALEEVGFTVPPGMDRLQVALDWPAKVVSAFAARQVPEFFTTRVKTSLLDDVEDVYAANDFHAVERWAIEAADQHGCSFVFVTLGDTSQGEPEYLLSARTALTATAELDPRSRRVTAALEIVGTTRVVLHLPGRVLTCVRRPARWMVEDEHPTGTSMVLCAPFVHGGSLEKPLGRSRVTNTVMSLTYAGMRTLLRQEVSAEFYQAPRFALLGVDESVFTDPVTGRKVSPLELLTGAIWAIPDIHPEDEADVPDQLRRAGFEQLSQLSMQPFSDQYRLLAAALSGAASIPPQYLGVVQDSNPTSAQAIEAQEVDLVREVRAQNPSLGVGRRTLALAILNAIYGELDSEQHAELRSLTPRWEDPRTRSMAEMSNMVHQQTQVGNFQAGSVSTLRQLPLSLEDVESVAEDARRAEGAGILDKVLESDRAGGTDDSLTDRATALGTLIRAGVTPQSAMRAAGLEGLDFLPDRPVTIRDESE